jgi:hypothetical protein
MSNAKIFGNWELDILLDIGNWILEIRYRPLSERSPERRGIGN